jgi:hypothetical protein
MSFTLAEPDGAFRTRSADSTDLGQGHKRIFGRRHALCFLATHRFSSGVSSRTNTSHRHGVNCLGAAYEWCHRTLEDTLFRNQDIRASYILFCRLSSQSAPPLCVCACHGYHQMAKMITHNRLPLHTTRRPSPSSPPPWILYLTSSFCHHTCVFSLSKGFHYPENNCECMSAFVGTRHH